MSDLFGNTDNPEATKPDATARFDWLTLFCHEKLGAPEGWRWFTWSRKNFDTPGEYLLVTGAICTAKIERGKRKGQDDWKRRDKATEATHAIRRGELEAFQKEWSIRTGLCFECYGTGRAWSGWSAEKGNRYEPCRHCKATGAAKAAA